MNEPKQEVVRYPATRITEVAKALSGDLRLRILEALGDRTMSVSQLAETLGVAQPTVSINVQILEQAELIVSATGANREKLCSTTSRSILLELPSRPGEGLQRIEEIHMPIGLYSHCSVTPTCGMVNREGAAIGSVDDPRAFYMPERTDAALLWFSGAGYVEYMFANPMPPGVELSELRLSAELCSEAPGFRMDWLSDVSLYVNDVLIGAWTCPGDFGDRKGKLTPQRWTSGTEYGRLTEWKVTSEGGYVNGERVRDASLAELGLRYHQPIRIRLEVREDAEHCGGLNLFGSAFGDHPQDLRLSFIRLAEPFGE
ncbi:helix-turn-helix domain-containing protein [Paenibacillus sp. TRM 82003]|nr:helix-turn-helix domain-containing protein [Paenibacillus sp. TRM 82003]